MTNRVMYPQLLIQAYALLTCRTFNFSNIDKLWSHREISGGRIQSARMGYDSRF